MAFSKQEFALLKPLQHLFKCSSFHQALLIFFIRYRFGSDRASYRKGYIFSFSVVKYTSNYYIKIKITRRNKISYSTTI